MFIIVDKLTGKILVEKLYTKLEKAENQINKSRSFTTIQPVVIALPSNSILKDIANGCEYGVVEYGGDYEFPPLDNN